MNKQKSIKLSLPEILKTEIVIEGLTTLICSRRNLDKIPKDDLEKQFESSLYPKVNGHYGFPSAGIKKSMVNAAKTYATRIDKSRAKGAFFIPVDYVEIEGSDPSPREDICCIPNARNQPAIKVIRAEFKTWKMKIPIEYDKNGPLTLEEILTLLAKAGHHVGIGAYRPECSGIHGRFIIKEGIQ